MMNLYSPSSAAHCSRECPVTWQNVLKSATELGSVATTANFSPGDSCLRNFLVFSTGSGHSKFLRSRLWVEEELLSGFIVGGSFETLRTDHYPF